jgi:hypothetical protein
MAMIVGQLPPDPHWIEAEYEGEIFRVCVDKAVWTLAFDAQFNTIPDDVDAMRGWFRDVFAKLVLTWELAATPEDAAAGTFLPVTLETLTLFPNSVFASIFGAVLKAVRLNFPKPAAPSSSGTPTDSPETTDAAPTANASPRRKRKSTNTTSS